jgi:hypothetical protein
MLGDESPKSHDGEPSPWMAISLPVNILLQTRFHHLLTRVGTRTRGMQKLEVKTKGLGMFLDGHNHKLNVKSRGIRSRKGRIINYAFAFMHLRIWVNFELLIRRAKRSRFLVTWRFRVTLLGKV